MTESPSTAGVLKSAAEFVDRFEAFWASPDPSALDGMLHPDAHLVQPLRPEMHGSAAYADELIRLLELCPDLAGRLLWWAVVPEGVVIEHTLSGTVAGKRFELRVLDRITLRAGKVAERIAYFDPSPLILTIATSPTAWLPYLRLIFRRAAANNSIRAISGILGRLLVSWPAGPRARSARQAIELGPW
ncbi:nuclear transport factor 2 family protein [Nocardia sp. NPDC127526]|uniref:nuclear transport factor 2 family protein n=1 Tax=Nocardia sp. NPDC127526 TaxID=3345393 RepID=UPI0036385812